MFNKRHYEAIAEVITRNFCDPNKGVLFEENPDYGMFQVELCELFERDNPNFNRARFVEACSIRNGFELSK